MRCSMSCHFFLRIIKKLFIMIAVSETELPDAYSFEKVLHHLRHSRPGLQFSLLGSTDIASEGFGSEEIQELSTHRFETGGAHVFQARLGGRTFRPIRSTPDLRAKKR